MSGEPPKQTAINIPADLPGATTQAGATESGATTKESGGDKSQDDSEKGGAGETGGTGGGDVGAGESVKEVMGFLESIHVKDKLEEELEHIDPDTVLERSTESENIQGRINKLDVIITIGLYYASLITDWLTSLGDSTSVGAFFFNIFFGSFNITQWKFGQLELVASISGMATTLQMGIFAIAASLYAIASVAKVNMPKQLSGPLYFGGPFQFVHIIKTSYNDYHQSTKSWDAQISQGIGVLSQILIIIAAGFAANTRVAELGALQPLSSGSSAVNSNFTPPAGTEIEGRPINVTDSAQVTMAVRHAALFATTTYAVSVVAIIMSSSLNVIQWMADVWRVNSDDILIYYIFKYVTRIICCYPVGVAVTEAATKVRSLTDSTFNTTKDPTATTTTDPTATTTTDPTATTATNSEKSDPSLQT